MDQYDENHFTYESDPLFPEVAAKAAAAGFRHATASEVRASVNSEWYALDLYSAYGGCWVRADMV